MKSPRARILPWTAVALIVGVSLVSYRNGGIVYLLISSVVNHGISLDVMRDWVERWGVLAPIAYVLAVILEVLIAPIPGTLIYAPAGAIFGGGWGGTLSLIGNVIGATVAAWIARTFGERLTARIDASRLAPIADKVRRRGVWVIAVLRVNPFTSSDLVSYAAGLVRMPLWQVAAGTLIGMAPLCYAQAYLAQQLFDWLPGSGWVLVGFGVAYAVVVIAILLGK